MLRQLNRRLRDQAVVTAAILSLVGTGAARAADGDDLFGADRNDRHTVTPIKHVIVIMGENRTFDHLFATYQPHPGEHVDNLLSKKIINIDGTPGPNYGLAVQNYALVTNTFSISPGGKTPYGTGGSALNVPSTSYAPKVPYTNIYDPVTGAAVNGPGAVATLALAHEATQDLRPQDYKLLLTGATGLPTKADTRIKNALSLPNGPYPLVTSSGGSLYDTYGGSPVHRFYQMWQQLDCDVHKATLKNPSGCQADLFPFVEQTVSSGSNGGLFSGTYPAEGDIALGFYNVANGDVPYLTELANKYTINDNYHQPVMGGTYANQMMFGYADALYYENADGTPGTPPSNQIENPNPQFGSNNFYTQDGYSGGSYTNCSDINQPGVAAIVGYLNAIEVSPNCAPGAYYLLNNYVPAFIGSGATDPVNNGPFTLPPVIKQRHIGDELSAHQVSWAYFGERWNDFKKAPGLGANGGTIDPPIGPAAYLYCNICNPFLYAASTMTNAAERTAHLKDTADLYDAIEDGKLPAVSWVKPSTFNDGHPASSKVDLLESFTHNIIDKVRANEDLWESTAILVTTDEGGGYYDSGYVQPVDYFGDGTRIPLLVVSKYSEGGHVSHEYSDHASIVKFIERNWKLGKLSSRSRDNLPNPKTSDANPYVPLNSPAIGDLFGNFNFGDHDHPGGDDDHGDR
jgi:phospholipase C